VEWVFPSVRTVFNAKKYLAYLLVTGHFNVHCKNDSNTCAEGLEVLVLLATGAWRYHLTTCKGLNAFV